MNISSEDTAQVSSTVTNETTENYIKAVADKDKEALGVLYEGTHAAVYGFALSILKNTHDAEDVMQDVYLKIWHTASDYQPLGKPMAWIFTITKNQALMYLRRQGKTVPVAPEDWQEDFADSESVTAEDRMFLDSMFRLLDDEECQIVTLHAVSGLKHREIASLLDLGLSTVLSKYSRALKKLRAVAEEAQ